MSAVMPRLSSHPLPQPCAALATASAPRPVRLLQTAENPLSGAQGGECCHICCMIRKPRAASETAVTALRLSFSASRTVSHTAVQNFCSRAGARLLDDSKSTIQHLRQMSNHLLNDHQKPNESPSDCLLSQLSCPSSQQAGIPWASNFQSASQ